MKIQYESLDIETLWIDNIAKPFSIGISNKEKILYFQTSVENIDDDKLIIFMLEKCKSNVTYYVHNLTFEMFVFIKYFNKYKINFEMISSNKTIYSAKIYYKNKIIKFKCSYRLTLLSLKDFAKFSNIENKHIFPYNILNENIKEYMKIKKKDFNNLEEYNSFIKEHGSYVNIYEILKKYCINDVLITKLCINKFWEIILESGLKNKNVLTAAKLSIANFFVKKTLIKKKIQIKYDRILRPYYFGGRTEVFGNPENYEDVILHYDWSGMYSQCMCEKVMGGEIYHSNIISSIDNPGFYNIKFKQNINFPILPIKYNNKLMFVNGVFSGWYWYEEIKLAIEYGVEILEISSVIFSQYYDFFLKEFVTINNNIRQKSNLHKQIGKNNNNTFYGRLGMSPDKMDEFILNDKSKINDYDKVVEINDTLLAYKKNEKNISNITISSSITSKARIKLYRGMMEVIKNGGKLLYSDTDSIIASFNKNNVPLDKQLGEVYFDSKKNDTVIIDAVFASPKTYALKFSDREVVKIKGLNSKPFFDEFKEKFYKKECIVNINIEWNKKDMQIEKKRKKKITNLYNLDKRIWSDDLKNTKPINFPYNNDI